MPGYNSTGDGYGGMDGFGNSREPGGKDKNKVTPDPQPSAEDIFGISPDLAFAVKKQQTPTNPGLGLGFLKDFSFGDFFDKAYKGTGQLFGSTSVPIQTGLFAANVANFQPQFDEAGNTIATSRFGKLGTSLHGSYNPNNPAYGFTETQKQNFLDRMYDPAETTKGYSVNELSAKEYADSIAPGVFDSLSLEKTAAEVGASVGQGPGGNNNRPINPYVSIDPVRSKYEDEALEAYDRYIESGYSPEEAEYLVAYMGLA